VTGYTSTWNQNVYKTIFQNIKHTRLYICWVQTLSANDQNWHVPTYKSKSGTTPFWKLILPKNANATLYILKTLHKFIFVNKEWNFLMAHKIVPFKLDWLSVINVPTGGLMITFSEIVAGYCQDQERNYSALHYHQTAV